MRGFLTNRNYQLNRGRAGSGNRTRTTSMGGWQATTTSCPQTQQLPQKFLNTYFHYIFHQNHSKHTQNKLLIYRVNEGSNFSGGLGVALKYI